VAPGGRRGCASGIGNSWELEDVARLWAGLIPSYRILYPRARTYYRSTLPHAMTPRVTSHVACYHVSWVLYLATALPSATTQKQPPPHPWTGRKRSLISNSITIYSPRHHPILPTIYPYHTIPIRHNYNNMITVPAQQSQSKECKMRYVIQKKTMIATQTKPTRYANNKDPGRRYNSRKREEKRK